MSRSMLATVAGLVLIIALALVATTAAGCGDAAKAAGGPLKLGIADQGKTFTVKVGDTVQVVLDGNPTTGYSWAAALDEKSAAMLKAAGDPVYTEGAHAENVVGAGGTFTFTFTAQAQGQATIKLVYARPWESVQPAQTFTATVTVQ